jgi:excisionase family DNA binding protein
LTVQEVAELARCEHRSVRRAINAGRLRAFRPTRKLLVREDDAHAWIESRRAVGRADRTLARPERRATRPTPASAVGSVARLQAIEGRSG